jgi:predicted regulator of Ras-like GTPase activity (Roadblock/LC7/MglB family)
MVVDEQAGVPVATGGGAIADADAAAALATAVVERLARAVGVAGFGRPGAVRLEGESGSLTCSSSGDLLGVVVAESVAGQDLLRHEVRRMAEELR